MSEFGQGFIYNFFLFAKHAERCAGTIERYEKLRKKYPNSFGEDRAISLWFNGAGDHFYDIEIPPQWVDHRIGKLAKRLQNKALKWRTEELGDRKDFEKFFDDCERLMRMIDKELGIKPIKAEWN